MITDEQLIERLRSSMNAAAADVLPPGDLLDGVSPPRTSDFKLPSFGGVGAVLAIASAVAVAAIAITSLRHTPAPPTQTVAPQTSPAPTANSLATLKSELAILRRRQTAVDKIAAWGVTAEERQNCSNCLNVARLIHSETRLLATIRVPRSYGDGPEHVYLVLGTIPKAWASALLSGWKQRGQAIGGLHLSLVGLTSRRSPGQPADELLNSAVNTPMPTQPLNARDVMITSFATIGVVPDGVTRVKWELANPGQTKPITVYPRVHGNVAIAPWTPAPRSTRLINEQWLVGATWYGADRHVIATFSTDLAKIGTGSDK